MPFHTLGRIGHEACTWCGEIAKMDMLDSLDSNSEACGQKESASDDHDSVWHLCLARPS